MIRHLMPWQATKPGDVTILRARDRRLTKLITADAIHPYDDASLFYVDAVRLDTIEDFELLLGELAPRADTAIVRCRLKVPVDPYTEIRCRIHDHPGQPALFEEVARDWVMVDVEPKAAPPWIDPVDPLLVGGHLRRLLPGPFRTARAIAQLSSGAGVKQGLRCHLWFKLDRPLTGADLKRLLTGVDGLDPATLRPRQLHFVGDPIFKDRDDPCGERIAILPGLPEVEVGHVPEPVVRQAFTPGRAFAPVGVAGAGGAERHAQNYLLRLAAKPPGQRHPEIVKAARHLLGLARDGLLDPIWVGSRIKGVASRWGDVAEVDRILEWAWSAVQQKEPGK
jgi:hypothetical protein